MNDKVTPEGPVRCMLAKSDDGREAALVFERRDGSRAAFALTANQLSRLVEQILIDAKQSTETRTPTSPPRTMATTPIPVSQLGLEPHPQDSSSALAAIQVGDLVLTFSMDVTMLRERYTHLAGLAPSSSPIDKH